MCAIVPLLVIQLITGCKINHTCCHVLIWLFNSMDVAPLTYYSILPLDLFSAGQQIHLCLNLDLKLRCFNCGYYLYF